MYISRIFPNLFTSARTAHGAGSASNPTAAGGASTSGDASVSNTTSSVVRDIPSTSNKTSGKNSNEAPKRTIDDVFKEHGAPKKSAKVYDRAWEQFLMWANQRDGALVNQREVRNNAT